MFSVVCEKSLSFPSVLRDNKIARDRSAKRAASGELRRREQRETRARLFLSLVGFSRTKTDCSQSMFSATAICDGHLFYPIPLCTLAENYPRRPARLVS